MSNEDLSNDRLDQKVFEYIEQNGPSTHEDISEDLEISWDIVQNSIRRLREDDKVSLTIDRRYEAV